MLDALPTIGGVGGSVFVTQSSPGTYLVTFGGSLADSAQPEITGAITAGTGVIYEVLGTQNWALVDDTVGGMVGGGQVYVDPINPNNIYAIQLQAENTAVLRMSSNGGQTWVTIPTVLPIQSTTAPLVVDSLNPDRLLVGGGTTSTLIESTNQGASWVSLNVPPTPTGTVQQIVVNGTAGTFTLTFSFGGATNSATFPFNATAAAVSAGLNALASVMNAGGVTVTLTGNVYTVSFLAILGMDYPAITASGAGGTTVVATIYGLNGVTALAISQYQGTFAVDPGFPYVTDLGSNQYDANTIYITDGSSIYASKDGGQNWVERDIPGLPALGSIQSLVVDPRPRYGLRRPQRVRQRQHL